MERYLNLVLSAMGSIGLGISGLLILYIWKRTRDVFFAAIGFALILFAISQAVATWLTSYDLLIFYLRIAGAALVVLGIVLNRSLGSK